MKYFDIDTGVYLAVALSIALAGCMEMEAGEAFEPQDSKTLPAEESPLLQEEGYIVADNDDATFGNTKAMSVADYESGWVTVGARTTTNIVFNNGFMPRMVSVWVQMYSCNGYWIPRYTNVPPAHSSRANMYSGGENVYWVDSKRVIVQHKAKLQGTNIHDGCNYQRFKVYAWQ